ncbi:Receptor-binding cancer antigen [Armadillidium vulgare]|nr:Receptor-binding cancer antigen [Armadillidium vulgare]
MFLMVAVRKVKSLLLFIFSIIHRCFCCFKRKNNSDEYLPVTVEIGSKEGSSNDDNNLSNWDSWDGLSSIVTDSASHKNPKLTPLQQQIEAYRLSQQKKLTEISPLEEEPNYFEDIAPKINRKPQIVILARQEEEQLVSNRISLSLSEPALQGSELLEWTEDIDGGWEEEDEQDLNVDAVLREQKEKIRQEKKAERLKRKLEKEKLMTSKLATKIS